jgi:hypothetical protein
LKGWRNNEVTERCVHQTKKPDTFVSGFLRKPLLIKDLECGLDGIFK